MRKCCRCENILPKYDEYKGHMCRECRSKQSKEYQLRRYAEKPYKGYMYIISNKAWNGWYKIGRAVDITNRLKSYQVGSPFRDYVVEYYARVNVPLLIERELIEIYGNADNEWYNIELQEAINLIKKYEND